MTNKQQLEFYLSDSTSTTHKNSGKLVILHNPLVSSVYKKFLDPGMLTSRFVPAKFGNLFVGQKRSVLISPLP